MAQGSASMMQIKDSKNIVQALTAMVQASVISSADSTRLTALVQSTQESESSDEDDQEPYKKDRGGIIGILENLLDKAQTQLQTARTAETANRNSFGMLKQSIEREMAADQKDMTHAKKDMAASDQAK